MATINYKENGEWKELAIGGGGGSIAVDSELSPTSKNPVQNKVITEALSDKANSRFLYIGDTQEECEYNLETIRLLDEGFTGCLFAAGTEDAPITMLFTTYKKEDGQWRLPLTFVDLAGSSDMYMYFEESGKMNMNLQDAFYATLNVNKNAGTEHVKKVISHYTNHTVTHMDLVTIAKMLPISNGALYLTWECEFDSAGKPLRVYASYNEGGMNHIDVFDLDGSLIRTVALPLTLHINGSNGDYVALSEYGKFLILKGDFVVHGSSSYHQPLSVKFADENNELIWYITILDDLEFVTYRLAPNGEMTFSSKTSLTTTN